MCFFWGWVVVQRGLPPARERQISPRQMKPESLSAKARTGGAPKLAVASMEKFSHSNCFFCGIWSHIAHLPRERELGSLSKRVVTEGVMKKCPPVNRVSSIFSSALRIVRHTHDKTATGMPLHIKIAPCTMYVCLYCQDSDCPSATDKRVFHNRGKSFCEKGMTTVFSPRAQSEQPTRGNTRLYQEETIGILPPFSASRQYGERSSSVQKDE